MSTEYDAALEIKAGLDNISCELTASLSQIRSDIPTLRQLYAGMAMQGLLSGPHRWAENEAEGNATFAARIAVTMADSLIAELNKKGTDQ